MFIHLLGFKYVGFHLSFFFIIKLIHFTKLYTNVYVVALIYLRIHKTVYMHISVYKYTNIYWAPYGKPFKYSLKLNVYANLI